MYTEQEMLVCTPYSSDSQTANYIASYVADDRPTLHLQMNTVSDGSLSLMTRATKLSILCSREETLKNIRLVSSTAELLEIEGQSMYGCPLL